MSLIFILRRLYKPVKRHINVLNTIYFLLGIVGFLLSCNTFLDVPVLPSKYSSEYETASILISYAYAETDFHQLYNLEYFLQVGCDVPASGQTMKWVFVSGTTWCTACSDRFSGSKNHGKIPSLGVNQHFEAGPFTLLYWDEREPDRRNLALHNVSIEFTKYRGDFKQYKYFVFLDSSVRGPFFPSYLPAEWHWTHAFLARLGGPRNVRAVSSSLVCLPEFDNGGFGPRMETWAFALDAEAVDVLKDAETFKIKTCLGCPEGRGEGEYGLTRALLDAGVNFTTLMSRYAPDTDWRDQRHWRCNNNVHPSRHGTYDGIAFHPYETVFVKTPWHVSDPYTRRYTDWSVQHIEGDKGTRGNFDNKLYRYAITPDAQEPNSLEEAYAAVDIAARQAFGP